MKLNELENVLLDQIEKLNDDSIGENVDEVKNMVERSKAISALTDNVMEINRFKLEVVKHCEQDGTLYEQFLGLEEPKKAKKKNA